MALSRAMRPSHGLITACRCAREQEQRRYAMTANQLPGSVTLRGVSVQTYARIAGVLFLLSFVGGGIGEFYAPAQLIVPGDATATAHNLLAHDLLYRLGFLAYLLEAFTDVA